MGLRKKILTVAVAGLFGAGVIQASPASANDVHAYSSATDCNPSNPNDMIGKPRVYLRYLQDYTPNPDKARLMFFTIANGTNHTMAVNNFEHHNSSGAVDWYMQGSFVLTTPNQAGQHTAGNVWAQNVPGYETWEAEQDAWNALPSRPSSQPNDPGGFDYGIYRNNGSWWNYERPRVAYWAPWNAPWWNTVKATGPYLRMVYTIQGQQSICNIWYP